MDSNYQISFRREEPKLTDSSPKSSARTSVPRPPALPMVQLKQIEVFKENVDPTPGPTPKAGQQRMTFNINEEPTGAPSESQYRNTMTKLSVKSGAKPAASEQPSLKSSPSSKP